MKRLILMRHAAAEHLSPSGDKARHLSPRGIQDAQEAGIALAGFDIDYALVSSATRTRETFAALGLGVPVEYQDALYQDGTDTMLQRISEMFDDQVSSLLVIGHAPTIPGLTAQLLYATDAAAADQAQCRFPTSAFSAFSFEGSWSQFDPAEVDSLRIESAGDPTSDEVTLPRLM
ncbi:MAG: SixA phosphatase family protein [Arachnia sp.]